MMLRTMTAAGWVASRAASSSAAAAAPAISSAVTVGDAFPMDAVVHRGFAGNTPDASQPMSSFLAGKKAIVVTLPGAFTPTWSTQQVPGYKAAAQDGRLAAAGVADVYILCVNDGAVMTAWSKAQGVDEVAHVHFLADTQAHLTTALGLVMTGAGNPHPFAQCAGPVYDGPNKALGFHTKRCKRSAMFVDNGVVRVLQVSEAADDPAGDDRPETSCVENMLKLIGELN